MPATIQRVEPEPIDVDREVSDGSAIASGGQIVGVPGHTLGGIAVLAAVAIRALARGLE